MSEWSDPGDVAEEIELAWMRSFDPDYQDPPPPRLPSPQWNMYVFHRDRRD